MDNRAARRSWFSLRCCRCCRFCRSARVRTHNGAGGGAGGHGMRTAARQTEEETMRSAFYREASKAAGDSQAPAKQRGSAEECFYAPLHAFARPLRAAATATLPGTTIGRRRRRRQWLLWRETTHRHPLVLGAVQVVAVRVDELVHVRPYCVRAGGQGDCRGRLLQLRTQPPELCLLRVRVRERRAPPPQPTSSGASATAH